MIRNALQRTLVNDAEGIVTDLKTVCPGTKSIYRNSIKWMPITDETGVSIYSTHKAAAFLEYGTGTHAGGTTYEIKPKYKKALRWTEHGTSGWRSFQHADLSWFKKKSKHSRDVFAKRVMHPGIKAQPHWRPTMKTWKPQVREDLIQTLRGIYRKAVKHYASGIGGLYGA